MLAFISLYNIMGWPAFVGVAVMIVSIPLNTLIARFLKKLQEKQMKNRDKRTRLMSDLLANIRRFAFAQFPRDSLLKCPSQHQALCLGERVHSMDIER